MRAGEPALLDSLLLRRCMVGIPSPLCRDEGVALCVRKLGVAMRLPAYCLIECESMPSVLSNISLAVSSSENNIHAREATSMYH